jgi:hypothetical protein
MKKATFLKKLTLIFVLPLFLVVFCQPFVANAQPESEIPSWAEPGVDIVYGGSLWEYFPAANVSSTITYMEQQFNIGTGNYTPNLYWDFGLFKFTVISADEQQGVFQAESGRLGLYGYEWNGEDVIWNYIWENQTWMENGTQTGFGLTIYSPPAQLSGNPTVTVGNYQAYKTTEITPQNRTIYRYYQKDTGRLLYMVAFSSDIDNDFSVFGLAATSMQTVVFEEQSLTVTSNSSISDMAYNATTGTLSFSATGQNGTTGYAEVVIPNELCANISSMKVYVDGLETEFEYTFMDYGYGYVYWIITVIYQHSTHDIQVTVPEFSSFALIACALTAIAAFASVRLKTRQKIS